MIQWKIKTEYSYGETFAPMDKVVSRLKELGTKAAAITDFGGTWGHVPWHKACREAGVQPMLGVELIVSEEEGKDSRMSFVARNQEGLREMYRATTKACQQKTKLKRGKFPRLYKTDVLKMSENIIKFVGDMQDVEFLKEIGAVVDIYPDSPVLAARKRLISKEAGLTTAEVCQNAYAREEDKGMLEIAAPFNMRPGRRHIFEVSESDLDLPEDYDLKTAPIISIEGADDKLWKLCRDGIEYRAKLNGLEWSDEYEERLQYEMDLIKSKDYASYFIVVSDMTVFAKEHMLVGPSRGSAAGSLVCYLSRITEIDPIPPGLIFERFIDATREDLPDIDLDFPDKKRHLVFEYMADKYGDANVAHIGTVSRYQAKSSLVAVCKRMRIPPSATSAVKVAMIERSSADSRASDCLADTFNETEPGRIFIKAYPEARLAGELEGHASHTGIHAAGLLVCNDEITEYCTVDEGGVAQVEKYTAEHLNLLKIDVLGLRTLSIIEDTGVLDNEGWYSLDLEDTGAMEIFDKELLCGIFQFEGNAMRAVASQMKPFSLTAVDAVTALARPGPFGSGVTHNYLQIKGGLKSVSTHPLVAEYMKETYGLPIYQEQTLAIVRNIGNFSWTESAQIRKLISKRMGTEYFQTFSERFMKGAEENGLPEKDAKEIWNSINTMGAWQMNKAHTYSYAVISVWCAWAKRYHPEKFALAVLKNSSSVDRNIELLREMKKEGMIEFAKLDWKVAQESWSIVDGAIMPGINCVKGFGPKLAEKFVSKRQSGTLTEKEIEKLSTGENSYSELFPIEKKYKSYYDGLEKVSGEVSRIETIPLKEDGTFEFKGATTTYYNIIGKVIYKNLRDANEAINVKKRGGGELQGQTIYLDFRFSDDTGQCLLRIPRHKYIGMGEPFFSRIEDGAELILRVEMFDGIRFGYVLKWKRIDGKQPSGTFG